MFLIFVTSAGVMSLGIMSALDWFGAIPNADAFLRHFKTIRTHIRTGDRPFVLVIDMAREFARTFYSSAAWQSCRNEYIKRAHYLCEDCMKRGIYKPAKEVHHIEELTPENIHKPEVALSFDNLVALCKDCHKARHNEREKGRRYLFGDNGEIILK